MAKTTLRRIAFTACAALGAAALLPAPAAPARLPILPGLAPILTPLLSPLLPPPPPAPAPAPADPVPAPAPTTTETTPAPSPSSTPAPPATSPAPTPPASADPPPSLVQALFPTCGSAVHPFAQFGDRNGYYGFPNNGFEDGLAGWRVSGASVVGGNEPWYVNGPGDSSLSLGAHGAAASPLVCINLLDPGWRMFARANGANGPLHAQVVFYGLTGNITGVLNVAALQPSKYGSWQPSVTIRSLLALPLLTKYAQLQVQSGATRGTWQIDDVFVDPWANRG